MSGFGEEQARYPEAAAASTEAPFEMANLYPRSTGLPMTVWVSPRGGARHDARVKVCRVHGNRMSPDELVPVSIRPEPRLIEGDLPPEDLAAVSAWIRLNEEILLAYWDGSADTTDLIRDLRPLR
ncbi:MAG: DUF4160 domain-containing protein [Acetobacteraceae bacterium]|nr:DUF4160 domain-containing protein [Acetobacteraceae bacterium]